MSDCYIRVKLASGNMTQLRILVVDDHELVRDGIRSTLQPHSDLQIIGEADNGEDAVTMVSELKPDLVIMDVGLPGISGLEATRQIKSENPTVPVLILTIHDEDEYIIPLLEAGAAGYLQKGVGHEDLVHSIRAVGRGEFVCDKIGHSAIMKHLMTHKVRSSEVSDVKHLTTREMQVLQLAADGMTNKNIGSKLEISPETVKMHLLNIFAKLQVGSRTEAVLTAIRNNWIEV